MIDGINDLSDIIKYLNPMSSVSVFPWFQYPYVIASDASKLFQLLVFLGIHTLPLLVLYIN